MKLNALFTDGAIFQRNQPLPVFGFTDANSKVQISFDGVTGYGISSGTGFFLVRLPSHEAGGPYRLEVKNLTTGDETVVNDILVGEVWLAGGQSNMEYPMSVNPAQWKDYKELKQDCSTLRMFTVPKRATTTLERDVCGKEPCYTTGDNPGRGDWWEYDSPRWEYASAEKCGKMSAVALWFAKELRDTLNVPVGIVASNWGGTFVEGWTSLERMRRNPYLAQKIIDYEEKLSTSEIWDGIKPDDILSKSDNLKEMAEKYCEPNPPDAGSGMGWGKIDFDDSAWKDFPVPSSWISENIGGNGVCWIRIPVDVPADWAGKDLILHLGGIDKTDTTFFNGEQVGSTGTGFAIDLWNIPRTYPVSGKFVKAGKNMIAIRAYSFIYDGSLNGDFDLYYLEQKEDKTKRIDFGGVTAKANMEVNFNLPSVTEKVLMGPLVANSYGILFDAMIRPLLPYGIRGAIWYQGETDTHEMEQADAYARMMSDMIDDWRFHWGQGDFPFIQVCLAGYQPNKPYSDDTWAHLRDSQRKAMRMTPNSGLASAVDLGDVNDIHPGDKRGVGHRLALWAFEHTYHIPGVFGTSPEVIGMVREGIGKIRLSFENCANGLVAKNGVLTGFYGADTSGNFKPVQATLEGNSVVVTAPEIPNICQVRYAWTKNPMKVLSLYNSAGLPANPFAIEL